MAETPDSAEPHAAVASGSARVELARLALEAALGAEGVVFADPGPLGRWVTGDGGERVLGVMCTALGDGRYVLDLHLVVKAVPLQPLAKQIRERVLQAAAGRGLAALLGPLNVTFENVV